MDIVKEVKKLNLPEGRYVVFGSGPLHVHGIRESKDIDILATEEVFESLRKTGEWQEVVRPNGVRVLLKGKYDIGKSWHSDNYHPTTQMLIDTAETIDGVPFANLNEVLKWKKGRGTPKDKRDVELMENYLLKRK